MARGQVLLSFRTMSHRLWWPMKRERDCKQEFEDIEDEEEGEEVEKVKPNVSMPREP